MGNVTRKTVKCKECGAVFEINVDKTISSKETELKQQLLSFKLPIKKCPYCEAKGVHQFPFEYINEEKKFIIRFNDLDEHISYYEDVIKKSNKKFDGIEIGATSLIDMNSKIIMLENGLDYRVGTLYQNILEKECLDYIKKNHCDFKMDFSTFNIHNNTLELVIFFENEEGKIATYPVPFLMDEYQKLYNENIDLLNNIFTYCFDIDIAEVYLNKKLNEESINKSEIIEFALVDYTNGHSGFAFILSFNEDKLMVGDYVCLMYEGDIETATIRRKFKMRECDVPIDFGSPIIAYKPRNIEIETSRDSDEELENEEYVETILKKAIKKDNINEVELSKKDVIVGVDCIVDEDDFQMVANNEKPSSNKISFEFRSACLDGKNYLKVYFNQKDFNEKNTSKAVMTFNDIVKIVINFPDEYDGILIILDKDDPNAILRWTQKRITIYRQNSFMLDPEKMKKLMLKIHGREKEFVEKLCYDCIYKVYIESKSPKQIAKELDLPEKDVHDALDLGYERIKHIVWSNFNV